MKVVMLAMPLLALFFAVSCHTDPNLPCLVLAASQILLIAALVSGWRRLRRGRPHQRRLAACCVILTAITIAGPCSSRNAVMVLLSPPGRVQAYARLSRSADPVGLGRRHGLAMRPGVGYLLEATAVPTPPVQTSVGWDDADLFNQQSVLAGPRTAADVLAHSRR